MLTLDRLRYFVELARTEHVGNAAKSAFVSPSVISAAILSLEEEFNCKLFDKEKNRLKLNSNGRFLLERADEIFSDIQNIYSEISNSPQELKGHFRLGGSPILVKDFLVKSFLSLKEVHPNITAEFSPCDTPTTAANIISGALDLALVFKSFQYHDVEEYILYEGQFQFCVCKSHPILKSKKSERVELLNELPALSFRPSLGPSPYENHPIYKKIGIKPKHSCFYNDNNLSVRILSETNTWAFLPDIVIRNNLDKVKPVSIAEKFDAPVRISLIKSKSRSASAFFDLLKNCLQKEFRK